MLWRLAKGKRSGWWTFGWFLVLSGAERFVVEFWRRNPEWFAGLTQPQWVAIASARSASCSILVFRTAARQRWRRSGASHAPRRAAPRSPRPSARR